MSEFLVESYVTSARAVHAEVRTTAQASNGGADVRYVRAIFVPEDEICFHVFEGPSRAAVAAVLARAGLADCRIVESVSTLVTQTERRR